MAMTQAQLLASLGAREVTGDKAGVLRAVEDPAKGVRITGEVFCLALPPAVLATITYREMGAEAVQACRLRAEPQGDGYAVTGFALGSAEPLQGGRWYFFDEDSACGFVRAVMLELEAKRLPDLDALLTVAGGPGRFMAIDWRS